MRKKIKITKINIDDYKKFEDYYLWLYNLKNKIMLILVVPALGIFLINTSKFKFLGAIFFVIAFITCIILFILEYFIKLKTRRCPKCSEKMTFVYPKFFDTTTTFKYICEKCKILIDTKEIRETGD